MPRLRAERTPGRRGAQAVFPPRAQRRAFAERPRSDKNEWMISQTPANLPLCVASLAGLSMLAALLSGPVQAGAGATVPLSSAARFALPAASSVMASINAGLHLVPLFPSKSDQGREGFVRLINRSDASGAVTITAIADDGLRSDAVRLEIGALRTVHLNSENLEDGAPDKGLPMGTGPAQGNRRLELASDLDIEVLAYIRTEDGFLTAMHDVVEPGTDGHRVAIFNPGANDRQRSVLRLINTGASETRVTVTGIDDSGHPGGRSEGEAEGAVTITLPPGGAREVTAAALESENARGGPDTLDDHAAPLQGRLGTGTGKWQLRVTSNEPVVVMSLLMSPTGHLTNLSTAPSARAPDPVGAKDPILDRLALPPGFEIRIVSSEVANARQMALGIDGTLYVGTLREGRGRVYALPNALREPGREAGMVVLAEGLTMPSGVAVRDGDLYVAAVNRVLRFADIGGRLEPNAAYDLVTDRLPNEEHHGWKYIKFGPDRQLYIPVGAPCNICESDDPRFASLMSMDPATGEARIMAHGIRNTVGFDWHPGAGQLWFSDNGRDWMGDDIPPEEFNVITGTGQHFGYPYVHATDILDPRYGSGRDPSDYTPPVLEIQAHSAALGVDFYTGSQFPARYRNALFVAEHGSWNRSSKVGYQVGVVVFEDGEPRYEPFVTGWLEGQRNWGRPNDVLVAPDGSLLISDDQFGAIYRVTYSGN